jgi:hypothetical protein
MSTYVVAVMEHRIDVDEPGFAFRLEACLDGRWESWRAILDRWWARPVAWPVELRASPSPAWHWREQQASAPELERCLQGPYGIWIDFGPTLLELHAPPKWGAFVEDAAVRAVVYGLGEAIARCVGATAVAYLPDSSKWLDDILETRWPFSHWIDGVARAAGPPATSIAGIRCGDPSAEYDGYFLATNLGSAAVPSPGGE